VNVRKFVEHALGDEGQSVVESVGLINLKLDPLQNADDSSDPRSESAEWKKITAGATEIPTRYRFRTGSSELDSKGQRDIGRIVGLLSQAKYRGKRITLIGFADSAGAAAANRELSAKRAAIIKDELSVEGLSVGELVGLGAQAFVAPNDTPENKERNRRVELWLK
jgi:phosphate transport system substrate-binding protein